MENNGNKVVLITGASSGIGEATARRLAEEGVKVALAARRKERLDAIAQEIVKGGGDALVIEVDMTDRNGVCNMVEEVAGKYGRVDALFSNAGLMAMAPLVNNRVDEWERMIDLNIKGVLYGVSAVWPIFEKQGSGHFLFVSSVAGLKVSAPGGVATKFAVKAIAEGVRVESAGKFRSTVLYPGFIESELMYGSGDEAIRKDMISRYEQNAIPADTIARAVSYALGQPDDTGINEITIRPKSQVF